MKTTCQKCNHDTVFKFRKKNQEWGLCTHCFNKAPFDTFKFIEHDDFWQHINDRIKENKNK